MLVSWEEQVMPSKAGRRVTGAQGQEGGARFHPVPRLRPPSALPHWFFQYVGAEQSALTESSREAGVGVWCPGQSQPVKASHALLWGPFLPCETREVPVSRGTALIVQLVMLQIEGGGNVVPGAFCHLGLSCAHISVASGLAGGERAAFVSLIWEENMTHGREASSQAAPAEGHSCLGKGHSWLLCHSRPPQQLPGCFPTLHMWCLCQEVLSGEEPPGQQGSEPTPRQ